jgi:hypothetical protein
MLIANGLGVAFDHEATPLKQDVYTMPSVFGRKLYFKYGADRRIPPTKAWAVVNDEVIPVVVIGLRSASGIGEQADYADCEGGRSISTFYLFPKARHCKPTLERVNDEYGYHSQWVAKVRAKTPW